MNRSPRPSPASARSVCASEPRRAGSSAAVGSSIRRSGGSTASARAIATRWASPPESSRGSAAARGADAERLEQGESADTGRVGRHPVGVDGRQRDVLGRGQVLEERVGLKDHAGEAPQRLQAGLGGKTAGRKLEAAQGDPPPVEGLEGDAGAQDRRLPRAGEAHERAHLAFADREIDAVEDRPSAARQRKPLDPQQVRHAAALQRRSSARARRDSGSDIAR